MNSNASKQKSPDDFWREYEEKTGEKVLARCMGQYVSGWDEFGDYTKYPLWGLIIATSGGFRFHHFPQDNWINALARIGSGSKAAPPEEKTFFIPGEKIISAKLHRETKWYKKIFSHNAPRLSVLYRDESGAEKELLLYAEYKPEGIAEALSVTSE